ncbi:cytochrome P450 [Pseudonocardia sp. KRD291]|uniref:cytochrome P450 n=1 Tax=Pseudonocardia sp. KRD291 TaxID=2792007 RepID=UPI001C4A1221|nr:cytochrome P450 [Pseudonocardia sp. KRD291]MBW0106304.1 cytochrome P450 [Pseudonocardia sp. KRD291]
MTTTPSTATATAAPGPGSSSSSLPTASPRETAQVLGGAVGPILAQGVIARRPWVVKLAGQLGTDDRSVRMLQGLRARHGDGPVRLPIPGRPAALVLGAADVRRVLEQTPEPFATASWEKRGALGHFQPRGVLVSHGAAREERRRFTEGVLETGSPMHSHAESITRVARQEAVALRADAAGSGVLDWPTFVTAWWRVVRRIVLGDHARDDHTLTDRLTALRRSANWSFLAPRRDDLRRQFHDGVARHLDRAETGSLAEMIASLSEQHPGTEGSGTEDLAPTDQVGHWMFAFDPAGAVTLRALALLAADPHLRGRVRAELAGRDLNQPQELPLLRAVVLESVRLWPTTPLLLRQTTQPTTWGAGELPTGTAMIIPTWFLHRDDRSRSDADRADPDQWLDGSAAQDWMLTPFSGGPGVCPGRELVLFTASTVLATLLEEHHHVLLPPERFAARGPLPRGLDPYSLRFGVGRSTAAGE